MSTFFRRPQGAAGSSSSESEAGVGNRPRPAARGRRKLLDTEQALYDYAVGVLSRSMRTEAELRRLMRQRIEDAATGEPMIAAVLERLRSHQYLSDVRYAASFASLRRDGRKLGPRRIAQDLRNKGVAADIITREVEGAFAETDELTQARAFLAKKRIAAPAAGDDRAKARILRMLVRAGFSPSIGFRVLGNWQPEGEDLSEI
jgi:regulatory protein